MARKGVLILLASVGLLVVIWLVYFTMDNNTVSFSADSPKPPPLLR